MLLGEISGLGFLTRIYSSRVAHWQRGQRVRGYVVTTRVLPRDGRRDSTELHLPYQGMVAPSSLPLSTPKTKRLSLSE
jgi:hypothetical protein